jgi:NAD(P)-dependent dehydrogenase (short-subunit alcohol dehydrogenase family)
MNLTPKRALIVGASSGIGCALARQMAADGARMVLAGRRLERLQALAESLGEGVSAARCDIRSCDDCRAVVDSAASTMGGLDTVVVAAGTTEFLSVADADEGAWDALVKTNLVGPALIARAAVRHLSGASPGRILFMGSVAARRPWPGLVPYCATKSGLETLAAGLQAECPELFVTCLVLGPTDTEVTDRFDIDMLKTRFRTWRNTGYITSPGSMKPEDVALQALVVLNAPFRVPTLVVEPGHPAAIRADPARSGRVGG